MDYIGISSGFHDAALSVINRRGDVVFAGHSERYTKIKHDKQITGDIVTDAMRYVNDDYEIHYYERPWLKFLRQVRSGENPKLASLSPKFQLSNDAISLLGNKNARGNKGKPKSEEHKLKMSLAGKGRPKSEEQKLKQSQAMSGRTQSDEVKLKKAKTLIGQRWWSKGSNSVKSRECPGVGWTIGRSSIKKNVK